MLILGNKRALTLTDKEIKTILDNPNPIIKIFHQEEYYFVKDLMSGDYFTHPNDLLTEEDNTWGHYDIIYNDIETNHEPRYFYSGNIARQIESLKYAENNSSYQYRLEKLITAILEAHLGEKDSSNEYLFLPLFNYRVKTLEVNFPTNQTDLKNLRLNSYYTYKFKDTGDQYYKYSEDSDGNNMKIETIDFLERLEVLDFIDSLTNVISDYLIFHEAQIEHQTLYLMIREYFEKKYVEEIDGALIRKLSGRLYTQMMEVDTFNQIVVRSAEGGTEYFEINDEIIIDSNTRYLYFKKTRLEHFYNTAHGAQIHEIVGQQGDTEITIPFPAKSLNDFTITFKDNTQSAVVDLKKGDKEFVYPLSYNANLGLENEIKTTTMLVKILDKEDSSQVYSSTFEGAQEIPVIEAMIPIGFDFTNEDTIKIYAKPKNVEWSLNYLNNFPSEGIQTLSFEDGIAKGVNLVQEWQNTKVKITKDYNGEKQTTILKPIEDFVYSTKIGPDNKPYDIIVLVQPIYDSCLIELKTIRKEEELEFIFDKKDIDVTGLTAEEIENNRRHVKFINPLTGNGNLIYRKIGAEYHLSLEENAPDYKQFSVDNENGTIVLAYPLRAEAMITVQKGKKLNQDDIADFVNNKIILKEPLGVTTQITLYRLADEHGDLKIRIYYRLRRLDEKYLSGYQSNWNMNDTLNMSFVFNRPLWKDGNQIYMLANNDSGVYTNEGKNYYEFFCEFVKEQVSYILDDDQLADLESLVDLLNKWFRDEAGPYINDLKDYEYKGYGGVLAPDYANADKWKQNGVIKALDQLIDNVAVINSRETLGEIYIGSTKPQLQSFTVTIEENGKTREETVTKPKLWVNTQSNNGNGLIYFYSNGYWIPVSAAWSPPDGRNIVI